MTGLLVEALLTRGQHAEVSRGNNDEDLHQLMPLGFNVQIPSIKYVSVIYTDLSRVKPGDIAPKYQGAARHVKAWGNAI